MKKLRFFAMMIVASLLSVSFTSCGDDDDDDTINNYEDYDSCTWDDLSKKASILSVFPKLNGTFKDGSVLLDQNYGDGKKADLVSFSYDASSDVLDSYAQKLQDKKFYIQRYGVVFSAFKVENGYEYAFQCIDGLFTISAIKYLNEEDYEYELEQYKERLENSTPSNATWSDVVKENVWLNDIPAPSFRFAQYRLESEKEVAITGQFSLTNLELYAQQLEAAGFVEMANSSRSSFKKDVSNGGYYYITMNEVMIDYRNFTED
ncbi:MAG: hypothetical protein MJZ34_09150 [Paludibacteraceae bacterium]|nr:hypothetical protein [Paludibacteraceae bacterium]